MQVFWPSGPSFSLPMDKDRSLYSGFLPPLVGHKFFCGGRASRRVKKLSVGVLR